MSEMEAALAAEVLRLRDVIGRARAALIFSEPSVAYQILKEGECDE